MGCDMDQDAVRVHLARRVTALEEEVESLCLQRDEAEALLSRAVSACTRLEAEVIRSQAYTAALRRQLKAAGLVPVKE
ncbi:MAG: hypothetical protein ACOC0M_00380 [Halomonas sp.]